MTNFEKFENEIKDIGYSFGVSQDGLIKRCGSTCSNCIFLNKKGSEECWSPWKINWLYEEYKEPLLTNEEREYLKAVIEPFRERIDEILFSDKNIHFHYDTHYTCSIPNTFDNNKLLKHSYTLEELDL